MEEVTLANQSIDEFFKDREDQGKTKDLPSNVKIAIQAQVSSEKLTSNEHWDYFLSVLEGYKQQTQEAMRSLDMLVWLPTTVSHEALISLKVNHAYNQGVVDALEQISEIPKRLVKDGETAQEIIKEFKTSYDA